MTTDGALNANQLAHIKRLRRILRFLATDERIAHMRDRMVVFGSAAAGKACPGDVDVMIDFTDFHGAAMHPTLIGQSSLLLAVGSQFYGCFDPFVKVGPFLYCRNEASNGWAEAKRARTMLKAAREGGRPASDVHDEIRRRPYEMGGAPPPREPEPEPSPGPGGP